MTDQKFWKCIDASLAETQDEQSAKLKSELSKLDKTELITFETAYRTKLHEAYHWDLWAAAFIINGGCSDDGFDYFCDWLISRGQKVYENALENPETLIGIATPWDTEYEEFRYIMMDVMSDQHQADFPKSTIQRPASPAAEDWDEDTVESKHPKLAEWVNTVEETQLPVVPKSTPTAKRRFWQRLFKKN